MTALQQHDSLGPHPALNWPVEITEFASLGDKLVERKKTPATVRRVWEHGVNGTDERDDPWFLCGTDLPGNIHFTLESQRGFMRDLLRDAGFRMDPRNNDPITHNGEPVVWYPPVPRLCIGDPRMDPTVLDEGCYAPWDPANWTVSEPGYTAAQLAAWERDHAYTGLHEDEEEWVDG